MSANAVKTCCTPAKAWAWVCDLAALALAGDPDGRRCLPQAVVHYLEAVRAGGGDG